MGSTAATPDKDKHATILGSGDKTNTDNDKRKLSVYEVDLAVAELRYQTAFKLEIVQAMMDGVSLGSEQVQDKRIGLLEVGPAMTDSEIITTIVMTLILEGTIGPAIGALAIHKFLVPVIKSTKNAILHMQKVPSTYEKLFSLYNQTLNHLTSTKRMQYNQKQAITLLAKAESILNNNIYKKIHSSQPVMEALNSICKINENNVNAAFKVPGQLRGSHSSDTPLDSQNSPGVEITSAAMQSASRLRLTIHATHEALENKIRHPDTTMDQVTTLLDEYRIDGRCDISQIRFSYQLATEVMIWAVLLLTNVEKDVMENRRDIQARISKSGRLERILDPGEYFPVKLTLVDEKLKKYLQVRFATEIERFARETNALVGSSRGLQHPTWGAKQSDTEKEDLLVAYLASVVDGLPEQSLKIW